MGLAQTTTNSSRASMQPNRRTPAADVESLRKRLAGRNPYLASVSDELRDAAGCYVSLTSNADSEDAVGWAAYAYRAAYSLPTSTRAQLHDAGEALIVLTQRRGAPTMDLTLPLEINGAVHAGSVLAVRFAVADLLHACGLCRAAARECLAALYRWAPHHDEAPNTIQTYLAESIAMLDQCGRPTQRRAMLNAYAGLLPEPGRTNTSGCLRGSTEHAVSAKRLAATKARAPPATSPPYPPSQAAAAVSETGGLARTSHKHAP